MLNRSKPPFTATLDDVRHITAVIAERDALAREVAQLKDANRQLFALAEQAVDLARRAMASNDARN